MVSHGNEQPKEVGRSALLMLEGLCFESIELLSEHGLLKLPPSTQLKRQTDDSKIVNYSLCYQMPNKALILAFKKQLCFLLKDVAQPSKILVLKK